MGIDRQGEDIMRTLFIATMLLTLAGGLVLADKATDERLANAAKVSPEACSTRLRVSWSCPV
jgi:hypothetical protein